MTKLILAAEQGLDVTALVQALGAERVEREALGSVLANQPEREAVLLLPSLRHDLVGSAAPDTALTRWIDRAEASLALAKTHRRSVLGLDAYDAVSAPDHVRALVSAWRTGAADPDPIAPPEAAASVDAAARDLLMIALVQGNAKARRLTVELAAIAAVIVERDIPSAPLAYEQVLTAAHGFEADTVALRGECERLKAALSCAAQNYAEAVEEADAAELRVSELTQATQMARSNYVEVLEEAEAGQTRYRATRKERNALRDQLGDQKRELSALEREIVKLKTKQKRSAEEIRLLKEMNEHLEGALEEMHASTSWRLTAPMRALKTALARQDALSERDE